MTTLNQQVESEFDRLNSLSNQSQSAAADIWGMALHLAHRSCNID